MTQSAVDFLPEDYVEKRAQKRTVVLFIGLFVLVMAGIVAAYLLPGAQYAATLAERDRVDQEYEDAGKRLAQRQEMEQEKQRMISKAEVTAMLLERVPRSRLMEELTRVLVSSQASMITMELKTREDAGPRISRLEAAKQTQNGAAPVAKPTAPEVTITITGMAATDGNVASFIESLGKSPLLCDVNLLYTEEFRRDGEDKPLRKFKVEMHLNPNADVRTNMAMAPGAGR